MSEHTKGQWAWYENPSGGCRVQTTGVGIADVLSRAGVPHPVQESCAANARLIAAAPEMLDALESAEKYLDECGPLLGEEDLESGVHEMLAIVRAAIAKARGAR